MMEPSHVFFLLATCLACALAMIPSSGPAPSATQTQSAPSSNTSSSGGQQVSQTNAYPNNPLYRQQTNPMQKPSSVYPSPTANSPYRSNNYQFPPTNQLSPYQAQMLTQKINSMYSQKPPMYNQQPSMYGQQTSMFGQQPSMYGQQPSMFGQQPSMYGQQPSMYGQQPSMYGQQPSRYGQQSNMFGRQAFPYGQQQSSMFGQQPSMFGQQYSRFGQQPSMYGQQPYMYGQQRPMYGQQQSMYGPSPYSQFNSMLGSQSSRPYNPWQRPTQQQSFPKGSPFSLFKQSNTPVPQTAKKTPAPTINPLLAQSVLKAKQSANTRLLTHYRNAYGCVKAMTHVPSALRMMYSRDFASGCGATANNTCGFATMKVNPHVHLNRQLLGPGRLQQIEQSLNMLDRFTAVAQASKKSGPQNNHGGMAAGGGPAGAMSGMNARTAPGGLSGMPGIPGMPGLPGMPRFPGMAGIPGMAGLPGMAGIPGMAGLPGMAGMPGMAGLPGMAGMPSMTGVPGMAGMPSMTGRPGMAGTPGGSLTNTLLRATIMAEITGLEVNEAREKYLPFTCVEVGVSAQTKMGMCCPGNVEILQLHQTQLGVIGAF